MVKQDLRPWQERASALDDGKKIDPLRKRIADLEAALGDALGAIWELHRWDSRENYERDPTVKRLMSLLPKSDAT